MTTSDRRPDGRPVAPVTEPLPAGPRPGPPPHRQPPPRPASASGPPGAGTGHHGLGAAASAYDVPAVPLLQLRGWGTTTIVALVVVTVLRVATFTASTTAELATLVPVDDRDVATTLPFATDVWILRLGAIGIGITLLLTLITGGVFATWLRRARRNATRLDPRNRAFGPGWAVGSWFVPLANLVLPALVVARTWRASRPRTAPGPVPVVLWWACAVLALATDVVTSYLGPGYTTGVARDVVTAQARAAVIGHGVASGLTVLAAILLISIIVRIGRWQRAAVLPPQA